GLSSGAMTLLPIGLAVVVNFALMSLLDIPLDISTALIANCAVGIGIDYSVHLMHRYQAERSVGKAPAEAIEAAAGASGRPIVFNAIAVAVGFLTLLLSGFLPMRSLAWLTAMTMIVAATAALAILPALLYLRDRDRPAVIP
ncbi:MAG: RND family transporter, partial [Deltaproteobacteria bacterium]|nr:RND family transporter [Deltaproteobacteria bacterium]